MKPLPARSARFLSDSEAFLLLKPFVRIVCRRQSLPLDLLQVFFPPHRFSDSVTYPHAPSPVRHMHQASAMDYNTHATLLPDKVAWVL